jgi:hypothetical protein
MEFGTSIDFQPVLAYPHWLAFVVLEWSRDYGLA